MAADYSLEQMVLLFDFGKRARQHLSVESDRLLVVVLVVRRPLVVVVGFVVVVA